MTTAEKIKRLEHLKEIYKAQSEGKIIQRLYSGVWFDIDLEPKLDWFTDYRIKPQEKKARYNKDTELSELMEGVIAKPAGFSYKSGLREISELLEKNNVKIEQIERYAKVEPFIKLMESWAEGDVDIEIQSKTSADEEWKKLDDDPEWNFPYVNYRAAPKVKEKTKTISATEEELETINILGKIVKHKKTGNIGMIGASREMEMLVEYNYFFNPETKCWEDWNDK